MRLSTGKTMKQDNVLKPCRERGSAIAEAMLCLVFLCFIFFGLMQIFQWAAAKMLCEYSAFYTAKAHALGYWHSIVIRAARVAATGASGQDISGSPATIPYSREALARRARDYMERGRYGAYQVNYEYWEGTEEYGDGRGGRLVIWPNNISFEPENVSVSVQLQNLPLLTPGIAHFLGNVTSVNIPAGEAIMYNYAGNYLE